MIEDSCNSFGTLWHGEQCGRFGDLAILSFRVGKPLSSGGGVLIINNPQIKNRSNFELAKVPAMSPVSSFFYFIRILLDYLAFNPLLLRFFTRPLRTYLRNSRLGRQIVRGGVVDTTSLPNPNKIRRIGMWQALIALANLEEYDNRVAIRRDVAKKILKACQDLPIKFLTEGLEDKWNGLFLPLLLSSDCAEEYVAWMMRYGFEVTRFHYGVPELIFSRQILERLPGTNLICERLVCVPCTYRMNDRIDRFYKATRLFFKMDIYRHIIS
jgi:dTDP-4-amino-4,6-dideoxygalactose transaminase